MTDAQPTITDLLGRLDHRLDTISGGIVELIAADRLMLAALQTLTAEPAPVAAPARRPWYTFKPLQEAGWFVASVTIPVMLAAMSDLVAGTTRIDDWKTYAFGLLFAVIRPIGGKILELYSKRLQPPAPPTPPASG